MRVSMFMWSMDFSEIGLLRLKFWNELLMLIIPSNKNKNKNSPYYWSRFIQNLSHGCPGIVQAFMIMYLSKLDGFALKFDDFGRNQ